YRVDDVLRDVDVDTDAGRRRPRDPRDQVVPRVVARIGHEVRRLIDESVTRVLYEITAEAGSAVHPKALPAPRRPGGRAERRAAVRVRQARDSRRRRDVPARVGVGLNGGTGMWTRGRVVQPTLFAWSVHRESDVAIAPGPRAVETPVQPKAELGPAELLLRSRSTGDLGADGRVCSTALEAAADRKELGGLSA